MVVDTGCMKCMDCVSVCPNDALYFGFGKPAVGVKHTIAKTYSLTWPEEVVAAAVFAASFLAVWDVYQLVPMLMALGVAAVTTFLAMRVVRLFRSADLSFYRFNLKSSGKMKTAGWAFIGFAAMWIGLNAHSGWVHYHESAGSVAFQNLQVPDELALAQTNPARWLSASDQANIAAGKQHYRDAVDYGLFTNADALPKFAWFEFLSGDAERAVQLLGRAADHQTGQARALSLYYRGAILNRMGRNEDALTSLDAALAERPDLIVAGEERGRFALATWTKAGCGIGVERCDREERRIAACVQFSGRSQCIGRRTQTRQSRTTSKPINTYRKTRSSTGCSACGYRKQA